MHQRAHVTDALFVDAVGGGVRHHDGGQALGVLLALPAEVIQIDRAVTERGDHHDPHAGHDRGGCIGAVRTRGNETDITLVLAS